MDTEAALAIALTGNEALVLYEFSSEDRKSEAHLVEDQAELRVLWDVEAILESSLVAPFATDYDDRLAAARDAVRDETFDP